jgi:WD40 repeat protein
MDLSEALRLCGEPQAATFRYCAAYETWKKSALAMATGSGQELIGLLADPRASVRQLAAEALASSACFEPDTCVWRSDRALGEQVLDFAEKEQDRSTRFRAAELVSKIDLQATGLRQRVEQLLIKGPDDLAQNVLNGVLEGNPSLFPTVVALTSASDPQLRNAAVRGLRWALGSKHHAEACELLLDVFASIGSDDSARSIVEGLRGQTPCAGSWDQFLDAAEQRSRALTRGDAYFLEAVWQLHARQEATAKQRARVLALARRVAGTVWHEPGVRVAALSLVARHDPEPLAYLRRFEKDSQPHVRREVERLMAEVTGRDQIARKEDERPRRRAAAPTPRTTSPAVKPKTPAKAAVLPAAPARGTDKSRTTATPAVQDFFAELLVPEGEAWDGSSDLLDSSRWGERPRFRSSPDGQLWVAIANERLRIIDARSGAQLYELERGNFSGFELEFSPDASVLAMRKPTPGVEHQVLRFLAARTGAELSSLDTGKDDQRTLTFARDANLAALIAGQNVIVYDLSVRSELKRFAIPASCLGSSSAKWLALNPRADAFVVASTKILCRLDAAGHQVWLFETLGDALLGISGLGFNEAAGIVAVAAPDGSILVLDALSGHELRRLEAPKRSSFSSLSLSADGRLLGTHDGSGIQLYVPSSGTSVLQTPGERIDLNVAGGFLIEDARGSSVLRPRAGIRVRESPPISLPVSALAVSDDGTLLATADSGGMIRVWSASDGRLVRLRNVALDNTRSSHIRALAWRPGSHTLAIAGPRLVQWNVDEDAPPRLSEPCEGDFLTHNQEGSKLVAVSGCHARVFDTATGLAEREIPGGTQNGRCGRPALSPDGSELATPYGSDHSGWLDDKPGKILVRRTEDGRPIRTLEPARKRLSSVAYSPDGSRLAAAGSGGITVFQARTGATLREIDDDAQFRAVAWSADGRAIAGLAERGGIKVWDSESGVLRSTNTTTDMQLAMAGGTPVTAGKGLTLWTDAPTRVRFDSSGNWASVRGQRLLRHDTGTLLLAAGGQVTAFDPLPPPRASAEPQLVLRNVGAPSPYAPERTIRTVQLDVANDGAGTAYWVGIMGTSEPPGAIVEAERIQRLEPGAFRHLTVRIASPAHEPGEAIAVTLEVVHAHGKGANTKVQLPPEPMGSVTFKDARLSDEAQGPTVRVHVENAGSGRLAPLVLTARLVRDAQVVARTEEVVDLVAGQSFDLGVALPAVLEEGAAFSLELFANPGLWPATVWTQTYALQVPSRRWPRIFLTILIAGAVLLVARSAHQRRARRQTPA